MQTIQERYSAIPVEARWSISVGSHSFDGIVKGVKQGGLRYEVWHSPTSSDTFDRYDVPIGVV